MSDYDHDHIHRAFQIAGPVALCHWIEGYKEGITRNAVSREGRLIVGTLEEPLADVFEHVDTIVADLLAAAAPTDPDRSREIPSEPDGSRWVQTHALLVGDHISCYGDEWRVMGFCSNGDAEVRLVGSRADSKRRIITKGNEVRLVGSEVSAERRSQILRGDDEAGGCGP